MAESLNPGREAALAAALIALGVQRKRSITAEQFDRVCDYAMDSLQGIGAFVDLDDLKGIDSLPGDEGVRLITSLKSKITNAIGAACDAFTAQLFELTFDFYLVTTAPEIIPALSGRLHELAERIGLNKSGLSKVLRTTETDAEAALVLFEKDLDDLISSHSRASEPRWSDAVGAKLGLGFMGSVLSLDLKQLLKIAKARRGKRGNS